MIEKDAYKAEKEARERRLMAYSDRIQNRMMEASSEIIDELVAERHRQNVTQQELADMTGILPSNLARFEKAEKFAGQCHLDICSIFVRLKIYFPMTSYSK